jgi:hypothetical protein
VSRFWDEVGEMVMQKTAQGASELSMALNHSADAYIAYGHGQDPLKVEGPAADWQAQLNAAAARSTGQEAQEMEMER